MTTTGLIITTTRATMYLRRKNIFLVKMYGMYEIHQCPTFQYTNVAPWSSLFASQLNPEKYALPRYDFDRCY
jgi:hypothetical protein